jgi:hypothetical protein
VDGITITPEHDFFTDAKCEPFNIYKTIYCYCKDEFIEEIYCLKKNEKIDTLSKFDNKWKKIPSSIKDINKFFKDKEDNGYVLEDRIEIISTLTQYSDNSDKDANLTKDIVQIYKDNRKYANKALITTNNGSNNYTIHCVKFQSKKIGKKLGITFNKDITLESDNAYINAIKETIKESRSDISCDTSTELNKKLCEKAIDLKLIEVSSAYMSKLHKSYKNIVLKN